MVLSCREDPNHAQISLGNEGENVPHDMTIEYYVLELDWRCLLRGVIEHVLVGVVCSSGSLLEIQIIASLIEQSGT